MTILTSADKGQAVVRTQKSPLCLCLLPRTSTCRSAPEGRLGQGPVGTAARAATPGSEEQRSQAQTWGRRAAELAAVVVQVALQPAASEPRRIQVEQAEREGPLEAEAAVVVPLVGVVTVETVGLRLAALVEEAAEADAEVGHPGPLGQTAPFSLVVLVETAATTRLAWAAERGQALLEQ